MRGRGSGVGVRGSGFRHAGTEARRGKRKTSGGGFCFWPSTANAAEYRSHGLITRATRRKVWDRLALEFSSLLQSLQSFQTFTGCGAVLARVGSGLWVTVFDLRSATSDSRWVGDCLIELVWARKAAFMSEFSSDAHCRHTCARSAEDGQDSRTRGLGSAGWAAAGRRGARGLGGSRASKGKTYEIGLCLWDCDIFC